MVKPMTEDSAPGTRRYEILLVAPDGKKRLFATAVVTENEATDYAKSLLLRHLDCERAEVWCGMKLIRQL
jgi:hypothetical protein